MKQVIFAALLATTVMLPAHAGSNDLLQQYAQQGAATPSAQRGEEMWQQTLLAVANSASAVAHPVIQLI